MYTSGRDYIYYSKVHDVYTRIDLLCVDHGALELLQSAETGNITISDHAPVSATLRLPDGSPRVWSWRLTENLLDDVTVVVKVTDTISNYFKENASDELGEGTIWEGHKAVVRGELISLGSKLKKERQADVRQVLTALQQAELQHKHHRDINALKSLNDQTLRKLFSHLLDRHVCRQQRYSSHKYHEHTRNLVG